MTMPLFGSPETEDVAVSAAPAAAPEPVPPAPAAPASRGDLTPTPFNQLYAPPAPPATPPADRGQVTWATPAVLWGIVGVLVALTLVGILSGWFTAPAPAAGPATAQDTAAAPPAATAATAPATLTLERAVIAFDAPGGTPLGALEEGRAYTVAQERGDWRQIDAAASGLVWVRAWEVDGQPAPTPPPTAAPVPTSAPPPPAPWSAPPAAPAFVPVGLPVVCLPVIDADNGNAYLGDCCGATSAERQQCAAGLLQNAPLPAQP